MAKAKGRAHLFEEPEKAAKDYDPEADLDAGSISGSDASEDANAGTEHYETVGKSKLRQKENVSLGPAYRGSKVSRAALDQESDENEDEDDDEEGDEAYADPDLIDLEADEAEASDSEIDSDNALGESDAEHFEGYTFRGSSKPAKAKAKRATAADFLSSSSDEEGDPNGADASDDEDEDEDMNDGLDELANGGGTSDEDEDEDNESSDEEESDSDDEAPKKIAGPKLQTMSGHSNPDVQKGLAIQQQRKVYDGLLNLRIRLQKALVASNTFPTVEDASEAESEPYEAAEEAAVKLLNTISSLKGTFGPAGGAGSKRKRDVERSMTAAQMWECLQEEDKRLSKARKANLEKWSQKVRAVNDASSRKSLVSSLEQQIDDTEYRLVKRTKVPRSCAPAQAAKRVTEDEDIFDDADFYQQLLKELVDQRMVDSSIEQASTVPSVMLTAARDVKTRKVVDRKASKGRKMRFTVHEKLQNFMAPEDRRVWEQGAIDRFFGTLFGQRLELNEEDVQSDEDDDLGGLSAEAEGLRLFK
ncbi:uncharacterized protein J7T54_003119 [Emericellopsis cladophorae]|uniref:Protein BFR2 n=1 Tax=Emericellopsis cladophorae TaxID=2686198 RepID=A0A9Q0BCM8_9HYPO|nr:uncharacterized protein J7T54_003119 [Emericellopsis cladophorae]KAI6780977.1 hypothetical protein J7T54_003119 [Emericellopsis cladophorae]